jgi:hypothetical protein
MFFPLATCPRPQRPTRLRRRCAPVSRAEPRSLPILFAGGLAPQSKTRLPVTRARTRAAATAGGAS